MERCDVLIAGGGPGGSTCAWKLGAAGLSVVVADRATFPRDKVCAGWLTPQALTELELDVDDYRRGRTFQPIVGFRVGTIHGDRPVEVTYPEPVGFGIRRCEFDAYLLRRSGAVVKDGWAIERLRREGRHWVVNDEIRTPMLVGAGGHFCPVARFVNQAYRDPESVVVLAQEVEFPVDGSAGRFTTEPGIPELFFSRDFDGYGWCCRKEHYLNIGFGRLGHAGLPRASADFIAFLESTARVPPGRRWPFRGHAYVVCDKIRRCVVNDGVLLVGDAAGVACGRSGEGIRPAIESALLAASTIAQADGHYTRDRLEVYNAVLRARFEVSATSRRLSRMLPSNLVPPVGSLLLRSHTFVRRVVLDRWFLHATESALTFSGPTGRSSASASAGPTKCDGRQLASPERSEP